MGIYVDDRTPEQKLTHRFAVVGTDTFMSGWGGAKGGMSYAGWAFQDGDEAKALSAVEGRSDMKRVRIVLLDTYRPKAARTHIYVWNGQSFH